MIELKPIYIQEYPFSAITVTLPHTNLLIITNDHGYVMCGALDINLLNDKLADRPIIAGRAVGVKSMEDLRKANLNMVTNHAKKYGWRQGMPIEEALLKIADL
ncbi:hypothetical protein JCM21714_1893 [Gracilibacillus boraciitolerans JCM 21714]|uniref:DUF1805 domain-containing protein n=1 Tax=Gracilibacillus boraciitolerans JCM 21714 TaxID=1298598 RepID=W4VI27_9BACI|nr:DUF1805 domain-containing protein [Gracilibacillus boraciitolerans]GAE92872.1 hypothetical protein JCM21714_1893 [Gracilibacillus boraciitolerans JCM 21714]